MKRKKSKYKFAVIDKKKYYFYKIIWLDILGDSIKEFDEMKPAEMVTQAYIYSKDNKYLKTFASYDANEAVFSDRNIIPVGCVVKMEKIEL
jgi:hypothetical protein